MRRTRVTFLLEGAPPDVAFVRDSLLRSAPRGGAVACAVATETLKDAPAGYSDDCACFSCVGWRDELRRFRLRA